MGNYRPSTTFNPNVNDEQRGETAWVIQTYSHEPLVDPALFVEKFEQIKAEWGKVRNRPLVKALSPKEFDQKKEDFFNERCEAEGIRRRVPVQQIAFYDKRLAESVAGHMMGNPHPIEMSVSKIYVRIDEYREQALEMMIPFFIVLENGKFTMEDNPYEIFEIRRPSADPNYPAIYSGTFWASNHFDALSTAQDWYDRWVRLK